MGPPTEPIDLTYLIEWLGPAHPNNYLPGRDWPAVDRIVNHHSYGSWDSVIATFKSPRSQVSAHLLIGRSGRIGQIVDFGDTAFAGEGNGSVPPRDPNFNERGIHIEWEWWPGLDPAFTGEQYAAGAWLHDYLLRNYPAIGVLVSGVTVLPHNWNVPTACPGALDLNRIVKEARYMDRTVIVSQAPNSQVLAQGEVRFLLCTWRWPDGRTREIGVKVVGRGQPGTDYVPVYPPVDPDSDPTIDLGAEPAHFLVTTAG